MRFARVPLGEAEGAVLAHGVRTRERALKKGAVLSGDDVAALRAAGIEAVTAAWLDTDDVAENEAALTVARAAAGPGVALGRAVTGRCNAYAERRGLAVIDRDRLDRCNLVDEAVAIATVTPYELVEPRDILATVKVIPLAAARAVVEACVAAASAPAPLISVAELKPKAVGLIQTRLPGTREAILEKTVETIGARLVRLGSSLLRESRCGHDEAEVAAAIGALGAEGAELILILGASAAIDRRDVVPAAVVSAGGAVDRFGMPVDPGNLTLLAHVGDVPVVGLPGSARSPRVHGFDWLLWRLLADVAVSGADIARMGAGGLLKEIPKRPLPRSKASPLRARPGAPLERPRIAALVLAAGRSRRMGKANKLLSEIGGEPMVARVAAAAAAARTEPVIVVTGHQAAKVRAALAGRGVTFAHNSDYAAGLSGSLRAGLAALPAGVDGVVVCLGDMPAVTAALIDRLIAAFDPAMGRAICVPTYRGKRGNPVLWGRRFFAEIETVAGDVGARHLIGEHDDQVHEVESPDDGVLIDIDTPAALASHGGGAGPNPDF